MDIFCVVCNAIVFVEDAESGHQRLFQRGNRCAHLMCVNCRRELREYQINACGLSVLINKRLYCELIRQDIVDLFNALEATTNAQLDYDIQDPLTVAMEDIKEAGKPILDYLDECIDSAGLFMFRPWDAVHAAAFNFQDVCVDIVTENPLFEQCEPEFRNVFPYSRFWGYEGKVDVGAREDRGIRTNVRWDYLEELHERPNPRFFR